MNAVGSFAAPRCERSMRLTHQVEQLSSQLSVAALRFLSAVAFIATDQSEGERFSVHAYSWMRKALTVSRAGEDLRQWIPMPYGNAIRMYVDGAQKSDLAD